VSVIIEAFYILGILFCSAGGIYAAYWSFIIRRKMMTRLYRRQTSIVGLFSLYGTVSIILFYAVYFFAPNLPTALKPILVSVQEFLYGITPAIGLAWADSSIRVGRRLDPLLRDSFRWSRMRWVLWTSMVLSNIAFFVGNGLTTAYGLLAKVGLASALILLGISVVVVFRAANRAADRDYRGSLEWFVAFLVFFLIYNAGFIPLLLVLSVNNLFVYTPVDFIWGIVANLMIIPMLFYCLYRCSRSLVPLNRLSLIDSSQSADEDPLGRVLTQSHSDQGKEPT
jgi:hypothetical protein